MEILSILIVLVMLGFGLWLLEQIPMQGTVKKVIIGVAIFLIVVWVLQNLGFIGNLNLK